MRKSWTDRIMWGAAAIVLAMAAALCIAGSIKSQAADTLRAREAYYEQLERDYIGQVRSFLAEQGYRNSGVTLSRIVDGEGQRSYRVLIHHSAIGRLEEEALTELLGQTEAMGFCVPGCSFTAQVLW
ncbi:MAG: hypothetical protein K2O34_07360 [Acetatifactor sp.]|nr:hypothetical protein [Acetatifactor sp.]